MNSTTQLFYPQLRLPPIPYLRPQSWQWRTRNPTILSLSFSSPHRRRNRSRRKPKKTDSSDSSFSDPTRLQFILDVDQLKNKSPISLQRTLSLCESKFHQFISCGTEAYRDFQNLITVEPGSNRIVFSCSQSTIRFVSGLVIWGCVALVAIRVLVNLGLGFMRGIGIGSGGVQVVRRRDRSLGGKEVVVGRQITEKQRSRSDLGTVERGWNSMQMDSIRREEKKLPNWWPGDVPTQVAGVNREEYQREANKLIRAIMDDKLRGKDVSEDDILELRRICRKSGVRVSIETDNARDSLYRLAVHNVINICCKARSPSIQIEGEDARVFVAGLAYDIRLTALRAATIVSAAVASRTRLWFLQAWALEMQAKHSETMEELKKICLIHRLFPPEPSSPEMEMVARGLQKHLKHEHREFLLNELVGVCGEESRRSAAEALGLV